MQQNRKKVINDPVWGFINIPNDFIYEIIQHPYFQRLRRIRQLGLTEFVYPGALHTRFHHALGAMHLMTEALKSLKGKGHFISDEEFEAAQLAILLHDIGHGPLSHALEYTLLNNINHEKITSHILELLNDQYQGKLSLAISIFNGTYHRPFFHQLVSSQLDMDRMDYLSRDCFFTGVSEGTIGADRLIKMLDIHEDKLVVEEKGIYSIENFLTARRLMYWQVYLHKTTLSAENMIISVIKRAKQLTDQKLLKFTPPTLSYFLENNVTLDQLKTDPKAFDVFLELDDFDIWYVIKTWQQEDDFVIRTLCQMILNRHLFKVSISNEITTEDKLDDLRANIQKNLHLNCPEDISFFVIKGFISNAAYLSENSQIMIKMKNGDILDVAEASDLPNIRALSKIVKKHYVCWPKIVSL
ncbi:MAG: HD domain-containing protein [Cytophagaceae bacterium]